MKYTEQEIGQIVDQLRAIKINDKRVFIAWIDDTETVYHTIFLDSGMGIQTLEFEKSHENKPEEEGTMTKHMFVATVETQGQRENDFCFVPEGEIVTFSVLTCTDEEIDGNCGCKRSMAGVTSLKSTTTMKVVEVPSVANLAEVIERSLEAGGWNVGSQYAMETARKIAESASQFPVGTIVELRGDTFQARQ